MIAFQEVALSIDQANVISDAINNQLGSPFYRSNIVKGWGPEKSLGEAILTKYPITRYEETRLPGCGRVAQSVSIHDGARQWNVVKTHLRHLPKYDECIRYKQIQFLLDCISMVPIENPGWILLGDMNATPESQTIQYFLEKFRSAYFSFHGAEPKSTFPTPLVQEEENSYPSSTIDYIFFSQPSFKVEDARLAFTHLHPEDPTLFPSDHYGLIATFS